MVYSDAFRILPSRIALYVASFLARPEVPDRLLKNQRIIWRRSFWINGAISIVVLTAGTLVAVNLGNPLPVQLPDYDLSGKILFGWIGIVGASGVIFPIYLALHARAVATPPRLRQLGLATIESLNTIQVPQAVQSDATTEFSRTVGVMTADATHWGLAEAFDGYSWGFAVRPSRLPLPIKRTVPTLSCRWEDIDIVEEIDYPSLISVFVVKLRDPPASFGIGLDSVRSLALPGYLRQHGVQIQFVNPQKWGPAGRIRTDPSRS